MGPGMRDANLAVRCGAVLVAFCCGVPFGREQTAITSYLSTHQYCVVVLYFLQSRCYIGSLCCLYSVG
jgi:hypothetical protein